MLVFTQRIAGFGDTPHNVRVADFDGTA